MISPALQSILRDHPLAITGVGAFCGTGQSAADLWAHARDAVCGAALEEFRWGNESWETPVHAAPPPGARLARFPRAGKLDRTIQLAILAADEALQQAGLDAEAAAKRTVGMVVGSSRGPRTKWMEAVERRSVFPSDAAISTIASLTGSLGQYFSVTGPSFTVSATCASGALAIALAAQHILIGAADIMLVGGTDAPLHPMMIAQLRATGVLGHHPDPAQTCRPFDRTRNGLCLGEGAGFLVIESHASAAARGAPALARLTGWSSAAENVGRAAVGAGGATLTRTMDDAIRTAGLLPEDISYINAHGTGTLMNDRAEAEALVTTFGSGCPPTSSTKPVTGHCLGASPVLEAILCIHALQQQLVPPTANCHDPEFPIDIVTLRARPAPLQHVLSNSLGFWGKHASLVFSR